MKHRANNYLEKRLSLNSYPGSNKILSNPLLSPYGASTAASYEVKKSYSCGDLALLPSDSKKFFNPLNQITNPKNSKNTVVYLIFLMCTIIFHLCSLITLTSSAEIRCVIKFFILFSLKITSLYIGLTRSIFLGVGTLFEKKLYLLFTTQALACSSKKKNLLRSNFFKRKTNSEAFFTSDGSSRGPCPLEAISDGTQKQNFNIFNKPTNIISLTKKTSMKKKVSLVKFPNIKKKQLHCKLEFVKSRTVSLQNDFLKKFILNSTKTLIKKLNIHLNSRELYEKKSKKSLGNLNSFKKKNLNPLFFSFLFYSFLPQKKLQKKKVAKKRSKFSFRFFNFNPYTLLTLSIYFLSFYSYNSFEY